MGGGGINVSGVLDCAGATGSNRGAQPAQHLRWP